MGVKRYARRVLGTAGMRQSPAEQNPELKIKAMELLTVVAATPWRVQEQKRKAALARDKQTIERLWGEVAWLRSQNTEWWEWYSWHWHNAWQAKDGDGLVSTLRCLGRHPVAAAAATGATTAP